MSPLPVWAGGLGALALCFLFLPLAFMLGRVNWATLGATLATPEAASALGLSLRTCAVALGVDLLLGVPAALVLSRSWRGVRVARILVALPLSLPPVVAGIVYKTDALAEGDAVDTVAIQGADEAVNKYPIALVSASTKKDLGQKWIDLVLSADGQKILEGAGFTPAAK